MCWNAKLPSFLFPSQNGPRATYSRRYGNQYKIPNEHPNAQKGKLEKS